MQHYTKLAKHFADFMKRFIILMQRFTKIIGLYRENPLRPAGRWEAEGKTAPPGCASSGRDGTPCRPGRAERRRWAACAPAAAPATSRRSPGGRHGVPSLPGCADFFCLVPKLRFSRSEVALRNALPRKLSFPLKRIPKLSFGTRGKRPADSADARVEGQRPADKPAQGNALGHGLGIGPALKGRNNLVPPFQG